MSRATGTGFRYIHQNPVKAGQSIEEWTSYDAYVGDAKVIDVDLVMGIFNNGITELDRYLKERNDDKSLDVEANTRLSDDRATALILSVGGVDSCHALKGLDKQHLRAMLSELKKRGLSVRQIERLTGINRGVIQKVRVSREPSETTEKATKN